jgi:methylenetetrahydrofolate dehydrogenase (NADP+) / methenyltetrahydrofolate cyclohydrolase
MNKIIDGNKTAKEIKDRLKEKTAKLEKKPSLAVIIVGDNQASRTYVNHKKRIVSMWVLNQLSMHCPETLHRMSCLP